MPSSFWTSRAGKKRRMFDSPFLSYAYSYPHKSAYRKLQPALDLQDVWSVENCQSLFLYLHIPFCEFRCGFCNLFTLAQPGASLPAAYLDVLRRQARQVACAVPNASFSQLAIGGGTPTYLNADQLCEMFSLLVDELGLDPNRIPCGCEASPSTIDPARLAVLRRFGVDRLSLGVQSFDDAEVSAIGRPQRSEQVHQAIGRIRDAGFATLNLDLIYGGQGQSTASWLRSVRRSIEYAAEEIYLYPLYVRQLTGLGRTTTAINLPEEERRRWDDQRLQAYRQAREMLIDHGYQQVSLRMFRSPSVANEPACRSSSQPVYCCQRDGMIGLGCGARSYTSSLHYSYEYAVGRKVLAKILETYLCRDDRALSKVEYGFRLDQEDRRRRYLILSLLQCEGLNRTAYADQFDADVLADFPMLRQLQDHDYLEIDDDRARLTESGIEYSDAIGPWLASSKVKQLEASYQWR